MKKLSEEDIKILSFPDVHLLTFEIDLVKKYLKFITDRSYLGDLGGKFIGKTEVTIRDWDSYEIRVGDGSGQERWTYLDQNTIRGNELREICISEFGKDQELIGFNVGTGDWTEYKFIKGKIEVQAVEEYVSKN